MSRVPLVGFAVKNFKSFPDLQNVPIRPLTLLFGGNSCGKSAFLRALVHAGNLTENFFEPYEPTDPWDDPVGPPHQRVGADIGVYPEYKHDRKDRVTLKFTLSGASVGASIAPDTHHDVAISTEYNVVHEGPPQAQDSLNVLGSLEVGDELLVGQHGFHGGAVLDSLIEWAMKECKERHWALPERESLVRLLTSKRILVQGTAAFPPYMALPRQQWQADQPQIELSDEEPTTTAESELLARPYDLIVERVRTVWDSVREGIRATTLNMDYLGPLRAIPDSVWTLSGPDTQGTPWWSVLASDGEARRMVNSWLAKMLGDQCIQLHLQMRGTAVPLSRHQADQVAAALVPIARRAIQAQKQVLSGSLDATFPELSSLDPEQVATLWAEHLRRSGGSDVTARIRLRVRGVERLMSPSEVGVGLSQMVPIVAAALASKGKLLLVEQPELHLHPSLQAELGDLFIESALGESENTWVIETHSEHLLLRIMRRIRETTNGRLPAGARPIRHEDVSLCFFERDGKSSVIHQVPLDEQGMLTRPWPGGFFEEGFREVFAW